MWSAVALVADSTLTLNGDYTNNLGLHLTTNAVLNRAGLGSTQGGINATNATINLGGSAIQVGTMVLPAPLSMCWAALPPRWPRSNIRRERCVLVRWRGGQHRPHARVG